MSRDRLLFGGPTGCNGSRDDCRCPAKGGLRNSNSKAVALNPVRGFSTTQRRSATRGRVASFPERLAFHDLERHYLDSRLWDAEVRMSHEHFRRLIGRTRLHDLIHHDVVTGVLHSRC